MLWFINTLWNNLDQVSVHDLQLLSYLGKIVKIYVLRVLHYIVVCVCTHHSMD